MHLAALELKLTADGDFFTVVVEWASANNLSQEYYTGSWTYWILCNDRCKTLNAEFHGGITMPVRSFFSRVPYVKQQLWEWFPHRTLIICMTTKIANYSCHPKRSVQEQMQSFVASANFRARLSPANRFYFLLLFSKWKHSHPNNCQYRRTWRKAFNSELKFKVKSVAVPIMLRTGSNCGRKSCITLNSTWNLLGITSASAPLFICWRMSHLRNFFAKFSVHKRYESQ